MNLGEIRSRIESQLAHAPDVRTHRDDLRKRINDAHAEILAAPAQWNFMERTARMRLFPTETIAQAGITRTTFTIQFPQPSTWSNADVDYHLVGAQAALPWADAGLHANGGLYEVESTSRSAPNVLIKLDPRYIDAVPTGDMEIRFPRYRLPQDCYALLSVLSRDDDQGSIRALSAWTESHQVRDFDKTGEPELYLADPNWISGINWATPASGGRKTSNDPPMSAPTGAQVAGGTLTPGATYRYFYTWHYGGRHSAPSPVGEITLAATMTRINLAGLDVLAAAYADTGRERVIWRQENEGPFYRVGVVTDPTVATFSDLNGLAAVLGDPRTVQRWDEVETASYKYIRFYPTPSVLKWVDLRYIKTPRRLRYDSDEPDIPEQHRMVLVWKVLEDLTAKHEGTEMERTARRRYKEGLRRMRSSCLADPGERRQRQSWTGPELDPSATYFGTVTYNPGP